jgi:hypothetical protein
MKNCLNIVFQAGAEVGGFAHYFPCELFALIKDTRQPKIALGPGIFFIVIITFYIIFLASQVVLHSLCTCAIT